MHIDVYILEDCIPFRELKCLGDFEAIGGGGFVYVVAGILRIFIFVLKWRWCYAVGKAHRL